MMAGMGGGGGGAAGEAQRLESVSIPQQFEWTGLQQDQNESSEYQNDEFWLTDLVLWNMLGYAVDDNNYVNTMLVCKRWKTFVERLEPPTIFCMSRLLEQGGNDQVGERHAQLLNRVLEALPNRSCSLYRFMPPTDDEAQTTTSSSPWPHLQPRFNVILMKYVHHLCTLRSPNNRSREVYDLTCAFLNTWAATAAVAMRNVIVEHPRLTTWEQVVPVMDKLLEHWHNWQELVSTVSEICGYLNRYFVRHHGLRTLEETADQAMVDQIIQPSLLDADAYGRALVLFFLLRPQNQDEELRFKDRILLLVGAQLCKQLQSFPTEANQSSSLGENVVAMTRMSPAVNAIFDGLDERVLPHLVTKLLHARQNQEQDHRQEQERVMRSLTDHPVVITAVPEKQRVHATFHFVESSSFLRNLHLQGGETLMLSVRASVLVKAMEFYNLDEREPFSGIPAPLPSSNMHELVSPAFASYLDDTDQVMLFQLITLANLLDLRGLLDLGCAAVSAMIKGKSTAEMRAIFNLPPDT